MRYLAALLLTPIAGTLLCSAAETTRLEGSVAIVIAADKAAPDSVLNAMRAEVESLVNAAGIDVSWPSPKDAATNVYSRLAMINLRGQCQAGPATAAAIKSNRQPPALGKTHVVDGNVLPVADVKCDEIHKFIERDLQAAPQSERHHLMGRAIGRVLAHELYHILLRTQAHGSTGLARPAQTVRELLAASDTFAQTDERRLSHALAAGEPIADSER